MHQWRQSLPSRTHGLDAPRCRRRAAAAGLDAGLERVVDPRLADVLCSAIHLIAERVGVVRQAALAAVAARRPVDPGRPGQSTCVSVATDQTADAGNRGDLDRRSSGLDRFLAIGGGGLAGHVARRSSSQQFAGADRCPSPAYPRPHHARHAGQLASRADGHGEYLARQNDASQCRLAPHAVIVSWRTRRSHRRATGLEKNDRPVARSGG